MKGKKSTARGILVVLFAALFAASAAIAGDIPNVMATAEAVTTSVELPALKGTLVFRSAGASACSRDTQDSATHLCVGLNITEFSSTTGYPPATTKVGVYFFKYSEEVSVVPMIYLISGTREEPASAWLSSLRQGTLGAKGDLNTLAFLQAIATDPLKGFRIVKLSDIVTELGISTELKAMWSDLVAATAKRTRFNGEEGTVKKEDVPKMGGMTHTWTNPSISGNLFGRSTAGAYTVSGYVQTRVLRVHYPLNQCPTQQMVYLPLLSMEQANVCYGGLGGPGKGSVPVTDDASTSMIPEIPAEAREFEKWAREAVKSAPLPVN